MFTAVDAGPYDESAIEVRSLRTGERKTIMRGGYYARYVPSGHLLYVHLGTLYAAPMDLKRLELTGPAAPVVEEVVSSTNGGFAQADFSQNGTLVYIRGKEASQTLVWIDSNGQTQPLRAAAAAYFGSVRFSPDGKRLALGWVEGGNQTLWVYEWERDTFTRLTFNPSLDGYPVWSPDGRHIIFNSVRHGGVLNLYWMRADGAGEAIRLTESKTEQYPFSFSADGKRLAFMEVSPQTGFDLWTLPLEEAGSDHPKLGKPEPFLVTPFNEHRPMISPDGRWVAYQSDESGRNEVYVRPFPGPGGKWQISNGYGTSPIWSH
jgi:Tol biopolymer transport system component